MLWKMIFFIFVDVVEVIIVDDFFLVLIFLIIKFDILNWFVFIRNDYLVF